MSCYSALEVGLISLTKSAVLGLANVIFVVLGGVVTPVAYAEGTPDLVEPFIKDIKKLSVINKIGSTRDIANPALFLALDDP